MIRDWVTIIRTQRIFSLREEAVTVTPPSSFHLFLSRFPPSLRFPPFTSFLGREEVKKEESLQGSDIFVFFALQPSNCGCLACLPFVVWTHTDGRINRRVDMGRRFRRRVSSLPEARQTFYCLHGECWTQYKWLAVFHHDRPLQLARQ